MRMREVGLVKKWSKDVMADTRKCLGNKKQNNNTADIEALTLASLKGAFYVYLIGLGVSLATYIGERVTFMSMKLVGL